MLKRIRRLWWIVRGKQTLEQRLAARMLMPDLPSWATEYGPSVPFPEHPPKGQIGVVRTEVRSES